MVWSPNRVRVVRAWRRFAGTGLRAWQFYVEGRVRLFERAEPVRVLYVDGQTFQTVTLRVVEYRVRGIEAHRLIVEQRTGVRSDLMKPSVGTRIRDRSEAVRVRFWKHELFDRIKYPHNLNLYFGCDSIRRHTLMQPLFHPRDDDLRSFATHRLT